jgi:hypothetical protein
MRFLIRDLSRKQFFFWKNGLGLGIFQKFYSIKMYKSGKNHKRAQPWISIFTVYTYLFKANCLELTPRDAFSTDRAHNKGRFAISRREIKCLYWRVHK